MNPLFRIDFSISDSLKSVRKSVLIYEIIISGQRITGLNTENQEHAEGLVRFDIVFYVRMKDGLSQIIINLSLIHI